MRPSAVQMVCLALGAVGLIGALRCCTLPQWIVGVRKHKHMASVEYQKGLWMDCEKQSTGQLECKLHDSMVAPSSLLQAFRAMTIISCILCGLSLLILFFGADFTTCVQNQDTKPKTILVAKVGLMLAGLLVIIPVSWVAHTPYALLVRDTPVKFMIGSCISVGWTAGVLMILAGVLLSCFSRPRSSSSGGTTKYYSNKALMVQTVCGAVGVIGLLGVIACCILPRWRVSAYTGLTKVTAPELVIFDGLWMSCVRQDTRQHCKVHDSILDSPFDLQTAGPLTITSCVLSGISLFILFSDANFITCKQNKDTKPKIILAAVGLQMAGLLVIIPVSWVAFTTVRDSYNPELLNVLKRELGVCIYIGWAAGVLMILTGGLLCCLSRPRSSCSGGNTSHYSNTASAADNDGI